jgi:hypothetical protein
MTLFANSWAEDLPERAAVKFCWIHACVPMSFSFTPQLALQQSQQQLLHSMLACDALRSCHSA